ncbi:MAG: hypothetical protein KBS81_06320, partial [Spirochaetales bacterium]|nr:hypothetical protein [Candidatus Physcosoma equi]
MKRILFLLLFLLILTLSSFAEDPDSADVNFRVTVNVPDFESFYGEDYSYINIGFTDTNPTASFNYKTP